MKTSLPLTLLVTLLLIGCAEKPASVGNGLPNIDGAFTIYYDTLTAASDSSYVIPYAAYPGLTDLTGRLNANEEFVSLIKFVPGGGIDSLRTATIDTVELRMTVTYRYFPAAAPVKLNIFEITSAWTDTGLTSTTFPSVTMGGTPIGSFSDSMNYTQVVTALITDTAAIRRWAYTYYDTSSAIPEFHGFAIRAPLGTTTGLVGFSSFNSFTVYLPSLFIRYTKSGRRDSIAFSTGIDTYAPVTTGSTVYPSITTRGGFGVRSKVKFDTQPLFHGDSVSKPIINNAVVELTLDTASSVFGGYSPDSVTAFFGLSGEYDASDLSSYVYGIRQAAVAGRSPVYAFSATKMTDKWTQYFNGVQNNGVTIRWAAEYGTAEKAVFFSNKNTDPAKRPRLIVTYSKK